MSLIFDSSLSNVDNNIKPATDLKGLIGLCMCTKSQTLSRVSTRAGAGSVSSVPLTVHST